MVQLPEVFGATIQRCSDAPISYSSNFLLLSLQDAETERPLKRYGSSQSQSSSDEALSPANSGCSLSPQFPASCSSLPLSSDDEKSPQKTLQTFNDKTYSISSGGTKVGESSTSVVVSQRDSQTVYSSNSFKNNVNCKSGKSVAFEVAPSPAESSATTEVSEESDFDVISDLDRVGSYVCSPANDYSNIFSPLETRKLSDENVMMINKGEKTPHTLKKRPTNMICYK